MSLRVLAPAKLNLTLEVGSRRADGLHPLQSAVMFADIGDWIDIAPASGLSLSIEGPFAVGVPADESNLVMRAARALAAAANLADAAAAITLNKQLPIASGMGGGSSDAAAALKALNRMWACQVPDAQLYDIARTLGADVPVCVWAKPAYMTGAGDIFAPMPAPDLFAVLVNPGVPLSTPSVYRRFDAMADGRGFFERGAPVWRTPSDVFTDMHARGNDLEPPARSLEPVLEEIGDHLASNARVRRYALSGSGADHVCARGRSRRGQRSCEHAAACSSRVVVSRYAIGRRLTPASALRG